MNQELIKYRARFKGTTKGAIGIEYPIWTTVTANNKEKARVTLYERFDHIKFLTLYEPGEKTPYEKYQEKKEKKENEDK